MCGQGLTRQPGAIAGTACVVWCPSSQADRQGLDELLAWTTGGGFRALLPCGQQSAGGRSRAGAPWPVQLVHRSPPSQLSRRCSEPPHESSECTPPPGMCSPRVTRSLGYAVPPHHTPANTLQGPVVRRSGRIKPSLDLPAIRPSPSGLGPCVRRVAPWRALTL